MFYQITLFQEYNLDGQKLTFNAWYNTVEEIPKVDIDVYDDWYHISETPEGRVYVNTSSVPVPALLIHIPDSIDIKDNDKIKSILNKVSKELFDKVAYWFYEKVNGYMFEAYQRLIGRNLNE